MPIYDNHITVNGPGPVLASLCDGNRLLWSTDAEGYRDSQCDHAASHALSPSATELPYPRTRQSPFTNCRGTSLAVSSGRASTECHHISHNAQLPAVGVRRLYSCLKVETPPIRKHICLHCCVIVYKNLNGQQTVYQQLPPCYCYRHVATIQNDSIVIEGHGRVHGSSVRRNFARCNVKSQTAVQPAVLEAIASAV